MILKNLMLKDLNNVFYLTVLFVVSAFVLVSPLSKIQGQLDYNSISSLKAETKKK